MKLKYQFEFMDMDDMVVAVPVGENASEFHGVVRLNDEAAAIFKLLQNETTEDEILADLSKQYISSPKEEIAAFLKDFIAEMSNKNLLK